MFSTHYDFQIGEDYYYSVFDITIAENNRPHKHEHVENGISQYTTNWEMIERDEGLRRGSSQIYLIEDRYYIKCSRTGLERAGNSLWISKNTPEKLVYTVVCSVFEGVLQRKSIDISEGIKKSDFFSNEGLTIGSPKEFVLASKCSQEELDSYYDELADLLYELIEKYKNADSVEEIENAVSWYKDCRKEIYRDYTDFEPTILSEVIPEMDGKNGWVIDDDDVDGAEDMYTIYHKNNGCDDNVFHIEINCDEEVRISEFGADNIIREEAYQSKDELRDILDSFMSFSFADLKEISRDK